ncbi:hypothetical protein PG993_013645 [Apiospora rasikravindrae]|uniref:RRM domain-containing protein n=1 Tax=Apiospora rasikravindrae TaxID=990691 RepID=A0ABR1RQS7_9PEZI
MDQENTIPSFAAPGSNKALAVRVTAGPSENEHSPSSQDDGDYTLASLVADSVAEDTVKGTVDGIKQLSTGDGPDATSIIPSPPRFVPRPVPAAHTRVEALRHASARYGGNRQAPSNLSADIPEEQNCSMFIRNLPPWLTYAQLFAAFRGVGRFASVHINHPTEEHATSAAKNRASAAELMRRIENREVVIDGYKANAAWDRIRVPAKPHVGGSRAIRVTGHPFVVNTEHLLSYFNAHFFFELEGMTLVHRGYATATVEIQFASFTNQAENAFRLIRKDGEFSGDKVSVNYIRDPCE